MRLSERDTYSSDDGVQKITIGTVDSGNGQIGGTYECLSSPVGALNISSMNGNLMWVHSQEVGKDRVAQFAVRFAVRFAAAQRPQGRPFSIIDTWKGNYETNDTMLLSGTRAYVNQEGEVQNISLGTKFSRGN